MDTSSATRFRHLVTALTALALSLAIGTGAAGAAAGNPKVDHSQFEELQGPLGSGPEVTVACLLCHTEASKQLHKTRHWTWIEVNPATGRQLGKRNIINNFCGSIVSNEPRCTSCHIGYGWKDGSFDFTSEENVDCLVCHDTTGDYRKFPAGAGHPAYQRTEWPAGSGRFIEPPDLAKVAQNVGPPSRRNCGTCHFLGGGGNAIKRGDLDLSMTKPGRYLDVHMSPDRLNFTCSECHKGAAHAAQGDGHATTAINVGDDGVPRPLDGSGTSCESCHGREPHPATSNEKLNEHTDRIACQTCHVPAFARGGYDTKVWWDWSTAGRRGENGKPLKVLNEHGLEVYSGMKGDFRWAEHVIPEYRWSDGTVEYTLLGDTIDGTELLEITRYGGGPDDPNSRIWPFKVMRGKQPYDKGLRTLAVIHLFGKDDAAYWRNYDWDRALTAGMAAVGATYSGEMGFVETEMARPVTHMVAPKEDAVACAECHTRNGRLQAIAGVYIPGRDRTAWLDTLGWTAALLALVGALGHGGLRYVARRRRRSAEP